MHVLYPAPPADEGERGTNGGAGYVMRSTRMVNRGRAKGIPEAVWGKVSNDGTVIGELGPSNLMKSLEPVWPADRQHIAIEDIRSWFASYVYMPRLRDEATLDGALQRLVEDIAEPYAFASGFDEDTGSYDGVIDGKASLPGSLGDGLVVRREAIRPEESVTERDGGDVTPHPSGPTQPKPGEAKDKPTHVEPGPKRFFASVPINPDKAGLEVARIMDGLLVELTRTQGSSLRLTLEIDGTATEQGYPMDVVDTVKANARDLKLDDSSFGFEQE